MVQYNEYLVSTVATDGLVIQAEWHIYTSVDHCGPVMTWSIFNKTHTIDTW